VYCVRDSYATETSALHLLSVSNLCTHYFTIVFAWPHQGWRQVYEAGKLTKFYTDVFFEEVVKVDSNKIPIDNTTSKFAGTVTVTVYL
jgi:hypothetical protein